MDLWTLERKLWTAGYETVCGCDEAGAGPLAGPVYAAAVILPREAAISGLHDSKKLSEKRREFLYDKITGCAAAWSVARVEAAEIDATDILSARLKVMQSAIENLPVRPDITLIDGNRDRGRSFTITVPHRLEVRGDERSASVAAASILAKVSRDRYMISELDVQYPQYGFARHKGYGTKYHYEMLDRFGPCPAHRKSFLRKWEARKQAAWEIQNQSAWEIRNQTVSGTYQLSGSAPGKADAPGRYTKQTLRRIRGNLGEDTAAEYLRRRGYDILDRQWRCRYGELDIVARSPDGTVCFVEVKLRRDGSMIPPREAVGYHKQERLRNAALSWLDEHETDAPARFDVAEVYAFPDGSVRLEYLEDAFVEDAFV